MNVASLELCRELYELSGIEWRPVVGLEKRFIVSTEGVVRSLPSRTGKGRERKPWINRENYCYIPYKDDKGKVRKLAVHRAVAEAYIPNPNSLPVVNHIDNDPLNNRLSNLEWVTVKGNVAHSIKTGTFVYFGREKN
jgi:hypothetical protein